MVYKGLTIFLRFIYSTYCLVFVIKDPINELRSFKDPIKIIQGSYHATRLLRTNFYGTILPLKYDTLNRG